MLDISLNGLLADKSQNQSSRIYFEIAKKHNFYFGGVVQLHLVKLFC